MKKLSSRQRLWLIRHARNQLRRRLLRRLEHIVYRRSRVPVRIAVPSDLSLSRNYEAVAEFIERFRQVALVERRRVYVDMRSIQYISPAATLMLVAELDRWRRVARIRLNPIDVSRMAPTVALALFEMGFFNLLGVASMRLPSDDAESSLRIIRFRNGNKSDGLAAASLNDALRDAAGGTLSLNEMALYDAVVEAMTNAVQHAYPSDVRLPLPILKDEWWITGSFNSSNGELMVFIYDQGIGIPAALPRSRYREKLRGWFMDLSQRVAQIPVASGIAAHDDGRMIQAAVELGRSSTEQQGRGHGLAEISSMVELHGGGQLRILSGRGEILVENGALRSVINHRNSLGGTLIQMTLTLRSSQLATI